MAARLWTDAQKNAQAEKICRWSPWALSTGPRTPEGKLIASRNSFKTGVYSKTLKTFNRVMARHAKLCATLRALAASGVSENELLALWAQPPAPHLAFGADLGVNRPAQTVLRW